MKRYFWLLAVVVMLALAGCGGQVAVPEAQADASAGVPGGLSLPNTVDVATVADLQGRADVVVFDVREPWEYEQGHIPGVTLIPMGEVPQRLDEIPTDKTVIITCRSGNRSGQVADYLRQQGYDNVHNMEGGILAWEKGGYTVER